MDLSARDYISLNIDKFKSTTPGPQGPDGPRGATGVGVNHMKGTSTTDPEGDFSTAGEYDTYTFYADANEKFPLAWFTIKNGEDPWRRAVDRGYRGTEEEFYTMLGMVEEYAMLSLEAVEITTENREQVALDAAQVAEDRIVVEEARDRAKDSLNEMQVLFLGHKDVDPTTDNFGNPLIEGALYYNTIDEVMKVWTGTEWYVLFMSDNIVTSFNGRVGDVELTNEDVTEATTYDLQVKMPEIDGRLDTIEEDVRLLELEAEEHVNDKENPHEVTKAQVGLGNADNTADVDKIVASAGRLTEGKKINNVVFDNTQDITITANTPNSSAISFDSGAIEGTDVYTFDGSEAKSVDIVAGLNVALVKEAGKITINVDDPEVNWHELQNVPSPTITLSGDVSGSAVMTELGSTTLEISITPVGAAGTYTKVTTNDKGQVISGDSLSHTDIPDIDASKITSGIIDSARLPSYVDDVLEFSSLGAFPLEGETGKIYVAIDTNKTYRWGGTSYVYITSGAVDSVAGKTGVVTLNKEDVGLNQVDNTSDVDKPISTATANALALKTDTATLESLNAFRADKVLASKDVANLIYSDGNLVKIRYTIDDDVDYEVLTYSGEDLTNVAHYLVGVLQGNTVLTYSGGNLVSSIFVGV